MTIPTRAWGGDVQGLLTACGGVPLLLTACGGGAVAPSTPVVAVDVPPITETSSVGDVSASSEVAPVRHLGRWTGNGLQDDGQTWRIVIEIRGPEEKPCATVEYSPDGDMSTGCGGEWRCEMPPSTAGRLIAVERILEGHQRCIDGCRVDADLRSGVVRFDCSHADVMAEAEIERVK